MHVFFFNSYWDVFVSMFYGCTCIFEVKKSSIFGLNNPCQSFEFFKIIICTSNIQIKKHHNFISFTPVYGH